MRPWQKNMATKRIMSISRTENSLLLIFFVIVSERSMFQRKLV